MCRRLDKNALTVAQARVIVSVLRARSSVKVDKDLKPDLSGPVNGSDEVRVGAGNVRLEVKERDDRPVADGNANVGETGSFDTVEVVECVERSVEETQRR
jgi:hypothetical protein